VQDKLEKTNAMYKVVANKHRCTKVFNEGDYVMVCMLERSDSLLEPTTS